MKKLFLFVMALAATFALHAQWVDDPINNNYVANCSSDAGEVYLAAEEESGDIYVQWSSSGNNGYGPTLQRISFEGNPQWGNDGIRINGLNFTSYSEGVAMVATTDNAVVSCFATEDGRTVAVKINAEGTFVWGEQGVSLFNNNAFSRAELVAGNDGGVWALGFDYSRLYLQYINSNGTLNPCAVVNVDGYRTMYGKLTLGNENSVFLTYEQVSSGMGLYASKDIYVIGYAVNGTPLGPAVRLMSTQSFQVTYLHHVVPDGLGGGYAYIWHPGIDQTFNTYVFHYNDAGASTISDLIGVPVHSADLSNFYVEAYATVDPVSHDLIIAYEQTDASTQTQSRVYVNRITPTGERVWGNGILVADYVGVSYSDIKVDAYEDGSGFTVIYSRSCEGNPYFSTIEAVGMDMNGDTLWTKTLSSSQYMRNVCRNTTGYKRGQNVVAWVNAADGGLLAQNVVPDSIYSPSDPIDPTDTIDSGIPDRINDVVIDVQRVFNMLGQVVEVDNLSELKPGIYILQGLTEEGRLVNRKVFVKGK